MLFLLSPLRVPPSRSEGFCVFWIVIGEDAGFGLIRILRSAVLLQVTICSPSVIVDFCTPALKKQILFNRLSYGESI